MTGLNVNTDQPSTVLLSTTGGSKMLRSALDLAWKYIFAPPFIGPLPKPTFTPTRNEPKPIPVVSALASKGDIGGRQPRTIPPVSVRPITRKADEPKILPDAPRPVMGYNDAPTDETFVEWLMRDNAASGPATCICELDENCLLLYRSREYNFELSEAVMEWLPDVVEVVESLCNATIHYANVALDEQLAQDVTLDVDDPQTTLANFWNEVEGDHLSYLDRTGTEGRWIESWIEQDGEINVTGLRTDRDTNDYQTRIRFHEMTKRTELFDAVVTAGLPLDQVATWVKARISIKRADAFREKQRAEHACLYTESFPLPSESQIRLRAYSSCLEVVLRDGARTKMKTWEPVVTTRYRDPKTYHGVTRQMRRQLTPQIVESVNERRRQQFAA